jgi:hypothetical protein
MATNSGMNELHSVTKMKGEEWKKSYALMSNPTVHSSQ